MEKEFTPEEKAEIIKLRPNDAEQILDGVKLFTQEDVIGDVEGSFAFITNNGVFKQGGVSLKGIQGEDAEGYYWLF